METVTQDHRFSELLEIQANERQNIELVKGFHALLDELKFEDIRNLLTENHEVHY